MALFPWLQPRCNAVLLVAPAALYLLGAAGARLAAAGKLSIDRGWQLSRITSTVDLLISVAFCSQALLHGTTLARKPEIDSVIRLGAVDFSFRFDPVTALMLLLVSFLGWVIVHYSRTYMAGDPRQARYGACLMGTLAAVSLLVVTNNLIVFLAAWVLTSLSLHGLLTLYPGRQAALIAAHKKFLASRLGDLTLLSAFVLLGVPSGTFEMDGVADHIARLHSVPASVHVAAYLLAISAAIKCAQLPLHGWLIQVMEAPTPVSALLHAGVVNLGGFMLIRLAAVMNTTPKAQGLLVVIGCLTAVISALVMTTRISIKVHLAWSTSAQMGFMLMECGLGLYHLAFLHLLAHSLYKAHAFLRAGDTVKQSVRKGTSDTESTRPGVVLGSCVGGLLIASAGALVWRSSSNLDASTIFCTMIVGLAISGIIAAALSRRSLASPLLLAFSALGVALLYFRCDTLLQRIVPAAAIDLNQQHTSLLFSALCFTVLFGVQTAIRINTRGRIARALYPRLYAGLYLDELFTRATFRIWPASQRQNASPGRDATQPFNVAGVSR